MQYRELRRAIINGWILWVLAAIFIVAMSLFVRKIVDNPPPPEWEMGGKEFVPASSIYGNGYYVEIPRSGERSAP